MSEYATQTEIDRMLGLTSEKEAESEPDGNSPENKIIEIVVAEDKLKKVTADKLDPDSKVSDEEISALKSKLSELEESQQRNGQDVREELNSVSNTIAELRGEVKSSPAVVQSGQILDTLKLLQSRVDKVEETLEAAKCPECGSIVGWSILPTEKYDEQEVNPNKRRFALPFVIPVVYGKRCPICKHFEQVKEEVEEEIDKIKEPEKKREPLMRHPCAFTGLFK